MSLLINPIKSASQFLLTIVVLAIIFATGWKLNSEFHFTPSLTAASFYLATGLAILYRIINPIGWALVLNALGHRVDLVLASRVWLLSESRRWLPGGIWGYTSRAVASKNVLQVPVAISSASMLIELLMTIAAAGIVAAIGMVCYWNCFATPISDWFNGCSITVADLSWGAMGLVAIALVCFAGRNRISRKFNRFTSKMEVLKSVNWKPKSLLLALGYMVLMAGMNGWVNQSLVIVVSSGAEIPLAAMIAATAIAWIVGLLVFFSPGGILVREAMLAALLLPWLPYEVGFSLAVLSRMAQLIAEVIAMGISVAFQSRPPGTDCADGRQFVCRTNSNRARVPSQGSRSSRVKVIGS